jgi:GT2 family glycosyltransferase
VPKLVHFAATAARKAYEALLDGRLPISPRAWLRDLRLHWAELAERPTAARVTVEGKAALTARLQRELDEFRGLQLATSDEPELSIVIVLYGRDELALRCLRSLATRAPFEVILVDNGASTLLERIGGARIIRNPENRGFPAAVNQAAAVARGKHLLLLNHDAAPRAGAIDSALSLSCGEVGAVGARLVLPDGSLQEAGSAVRDDGSCAGLGRGTSPDDARWQFQRDVDFCSGAFLLTPLALFRELGGFDEGYGPAYYEEVDYCVRLWKAGRRVVYDPGAVVDHFEFASSPAPAVAMRMQAERRARFVGRHRGWRRPAAKCRTLIFDDRVPHAQLGAGFPRALAILRALAADGHQVTLYPTIWPDDDWAAVYAELPRAVEVVLGSGWPGVRRFWAERHGEFDRVIISRPNNLRMLRTRLQPWPPKNLIYDAEALFALRDGGDAAAEAALAEGARAVLAVSAEEARHFAAPTHVVGHALTPAPTPRPFAAREGLLFVGAFQTEDSPNSDAVRWFAREARPEIRRRLGEISFTVVGARPPASVRAVTAVQERVADLQPLYDRARLFVAPTRFAAGLPYKVHHAAAHGLPVVCTPLLQKQLGWGDEVRAGDDLIAAVCALYRDEAAWQRQREAALRRVAADCDPQIFAAALREALS